MKKTYAVHPAIGIARVGDSPDDYFVGPEAPGVAPSPSKPGAPSVRAKFKDALKRIKRQGARFRIYEFTRDGSGPDGCSGDHRLRRAYRVACAPSERKSGRAEISERWQAEPWNSREQAGNRCRESDDQRGLPSHEAAERHVSGILRITPLKCRLATRLLMTQGA